MPGGKSYSDERVADGGIGHDDEARDEALTSVQALMDAYPRTCNVKFGLKPQVIFVEPQD